ncbi:alpha-hydroxy acid oxidase [Variovorax sp. PDNC026]|uniref:alpha-hydroxy acid oxidase n=1 Tax=Variovorax sp. PDNC026 TaxID=2811425 RepID=UPI001F0642F0|nr:alpha-hydroxy acid oxidase [Variovorax sp. PDNC026]
MLSLADVERAALARLPDCVGGFIRGGAEDEHSLRRNRHSFERYALVPRGLAGVTRRSQETELWGQRYRTAFGIAPMGNCCLAAFECDLALARAAAGQGLPYILSGFSNVALERVRDEVPQLWYQGYLPGDLDRIGKLMERLRRAGTEVLVVTIDTAVGANRENNARAGFGIPLRWTPRLAWDGMRHPRWSASVLARTLLRSGVPGFPNFTDGPGMRIVDMPRDDFRAGRDALDWGHVAWIRERWRGRLVLKGVLHPGDAARASSLGVDGVIVSNHGGRQLDGAASALDMLPAVVAAVPAGYPVMMDGGIRRGNDVVKALALGARMVFLGRPMLYGAAVAGQAGVEAVIRLLHAEVDRDLALLGCADVGQLTPDVLHRQA